MKYLDLLFEETGIELDRSTTPIVLYSTEYMLDLGKLISETPKR